MARLPGFELQREPTNMWRLKRATWFDKLNIAIDQFGLTKSISDHSISVQRSFDTIILVIYFNDIVLTNDDY